MDDEDILKEARLSKELFEYLMEGINKYCETRNIRNIHVLSAIICLFAKLIVEEEISPQDGIEMFITPYNEFYHGLIKMKKEEEKNG